MPPPITRFSDRVAAVLAVGTGAPLYLTVMLEGDSDLLVTPLISGGAGRRWSTGLGLTGTPATRVGLGGGS